MKPSYCVQNDGDCESCSLVNYGRDCQNNLLYKPEPLLTDDQARRLDDEAARLRREGMGVL